MDEPTSLEALSFEFFREFARCEYCLKAVGLRERKRRDPTADWSAFAEQVQSVFDYPPSEEVATAIRYYLNSPPKKQIVRNGVLDWAQSEPDHKSQAELVLRLVCRVRNNLFHGGKFNGHWFEPQRSEELLRFGLCVLRAVVSAHPEVGKAYDQRAA
jgi:hypothetical protein